MGIDYTTFLKENSQYIEISLGKAKNLKGQKFNKLTPIIRVKNLEVKNDNVYWLCKCDCGNFTVTNSSSLITGHTKSCGCYHKKKLKEAIIDETGNKYGRLTVIKRLNNEEIKRTTSCTYWKCRCDCGNIVNVRGTALRDGTTSSCGCLISKGEEKISQLLTKLNIAFRTQYKFKDLKDIDLLRFDFAIFKNNNLFCLIEFQGEQHYRNVHGYYNQYRFEDLKKKDNMKKEYCKKNNIKLIEINYLDLHKLDENYLLSLINWE